MNTQQARALLSYYLLILTSLQCLHNENANNKNWDRRQGFIVILLDTIA